MEDNAPESALKLEYVGSGHLDLDDALKSDAEFRERVSAKKAHSQKELKKIYLDLETERDTKTRAALKSLLANPGPKPLEALSPELAQRAIKTTIVVEDKQKNKERQIKAGSFVSKEGWIRINPCACELVSGEIADPCLIYPSDIDWTNIRQYRDRIKVGGQVKRFLPTRFLLPAKLIQAAAERLEYRMGFYLPLLASAKGQAKYLVPASSIFFETPGVLGADLDPNFTGEPEEKENLLGHYTHGDPMWNKVTIVLADLSN